MPRKAPGEDGVTVWWIIASALVIAWIPLLLAIVLGRIEERSGRRE
jgi:hypothetical protein